MTDTSHDMEPFNLQFPFTRTLGSTLSTFFSALAKGQLIGVKVGDRVIAPPLEYDPETAADAGSDWVKVGPKGTVSTWTWVPQPTHLHTLQEPFAFAFITLDGADTPMIHVVQASEDQMQAGLRVEAQFKPEGEANGRIDDIVAFVPAADPSPSVGAGEPYEAPAEPEIQNMDSYCDLVYIDNASPSTRLWMDSLMNGKLIGQVCPVCNRTYVGAPRPVLRRRRRARRQHPGRGLRQGRGRQLHGDHPDPVPRADRDRAVRALLDPARRHRRRHGPAVDHRRPRLGGPGGHARRDRVGPRGRAQRRGHREPRLRRHRWRRARLAPHWRAGRAGRELHRTDDVMPRTENDIAIVGYAQSPMLRRTEHTETEMMLPVVQGAIKMAGLTRDDIDFTGRGSCDYITGQAFSFVAEPRRHRRLAAEARLARRDGRRLGAVRGVAAPPAGRHRHRRGRRLGPLVHRRPVARLPDGDGPVLPGPARRRPAVASPRCRPGR